MKSSQPTCMFRRILLGRASPRRSRLPKCRPRLPSSRTYATATVSAADLKFGQPLNETHPHLIRAGEITPGISAQEYANRRSKLAAKLPRGAIAIIAASDIKYRSGAAFYEFHQASNFFYFTGFNEPDAVAIIERTGDLEEHVFHLFLRPKDPRAELWDGARSGIQAALDVFNADEAQDISDLRTALPSIVSKADEVFIDLPPAAMPKSTFASLFSTPSPRLQGVAALLEKCKQKPFQAIANELRVLKSDAEISNMRHAGKVSGRAFTDAMRQKFALEKDLAAYLDYHFKIGGCDASAYVPVVAGGEV
ncbi:MAG: hypothetical protein M1825_001927 [Sarcosagium campestre]|nr:MAG: hypothetical protein M1825_001927 [Sarcosagium campestre]